MAEKKKGTGPDPRTPSDRERVPRGREAERYAAAQGLVAAANDRQRILGERAAKLAMAPDRRVGAGEVIDVVEFFLAGERYAFETSFVREIHPLKNFTPLPCTPPFVVGIMNIRGQIISIIDLKRFFDLPDKGLADLNKVIVLKGNELEFGILADAVIGAASLKENELQPSLPTFTGIRELYLKGITREGAVVLDAQNMLSDERLIVHEQVKG